MRLHVVRIAKFPAAERARKGHHLLRSTRSLFWLCCRGLRLMFRWLRWRGGRWRARLLDRSSVRRSVNAQMNAGGKRPRAFRALESTGGRFVISRILSSFFVWREGGDAAESVRDSSSPGRPWTQNSQRGASDLELRLRLGSGSIRDSSSTGSVLDLGIARGRKRPRAAAESPRRRPLSLPQAAGSVRQVDGASRIHSARRTTSTHCDV